MRPSLIICPGKYRNLLERSLQISFRHPIALDSKEVLLLLSETSSSSIVRVLDDIARRPNLGPRHEQWLPCLVVCYPTAQQREVVL
jgi:hypothetical protein